MSKFTPGPWEAGVNPRGMGANDWVVRPKGEFPHGEWIADVGYGSTDPTRRANARLIAAAPDMYSALEAAEQSIADFMRTVQYPSESGAGSILSQIRAALAKADGKP